MRAVDGRGDAGRRVVELHRLRRWAAQREYAYRECDIWASVVLMGMGSWGSWLARRRRFTVAAVFTMSSVSRRVLSVSVMLFQAARTGLWLLLRSRAVA